MDAKKSNRYLFIGNRVSHQYYNLYDYLDEEMMSHCLILSGFYLEKGCKHTTFWYILNVGIIVLSPIISLFFFINNKVYSVCCF